MFEITPGEQRRLMEMSAGLMKAAAPEVRRKTTSRLRGLDSAGIVKTKRHQETRGIKPV